MSKLCIQTLGFETCVNIFQLPWSPVRLYPSLSHSFSPVPIRNQKHVITHYFHFLVVHEFFLFFFFDRMVWFGYTRAMRPRVYAFQPVCICVGAARHSKYGPVNFSLSQSRIQDAMGLPHLYWYNTHSVYREWITTPMKMSECETNTVVQTAERARGTHRR